MPLFYLIRHGRSTWNAEGRMQGQADPPLDDIGRRQSLALAEYLRHEEIHAIYSSPLRRSRETAEPLAAAHNLPIQFDERLMERHLGDWTGLTGSEADERFPKRLDRNWWIDGPPGGENQVALTTRVAAAFDAMLAAHPDDTVAVVSHGGSLSAFLAHVIGIQPDRRVSFSFENTAVARLILEEGRVRLVSLGETYHLDKELRGPGWHAK